MRKMLPAAAAAVALLAASAASAATMTFDFDTLNSKITVSNDKTLCFGSCALTASLDTPFSSFTLAQGQSQTFDFAVFNIARGFGGGTADVDATLAFTLPDTIDGPATTGGKGIYGTLGGKISAGGLFWTDPVQQFTTTDGSTFTVQFHDLLGAEFGNNAIDKVTITADNIVDPVPEPGVWAMFIVGAGAAGASLRRKSVKAFAAAA